MAVMYFIMGALFTYIAVENVKQSGWNFIAYLFTFVAALDFGACYRYLRLNKKRKE